MHEPKICFLGLGSHAQRGHLMHLARMPIAREIGVYDPGNPDVMLVDDPDHPGMKVKAVDESRLLWFTGEAEAVRWADAVLVCSPDRFHYDQMFMALHFGRHVFCEKPMASLSEEASLAEVMAMAKARKVTLTSCHPRRFDEPYVRLREMLPALEARFGLLLEVSLDFSYHTPSKEDLHGGSLLQDHINHEIDYFSWLVGGVRNLKAMKLHDSFDRYHVSGSGRGVLFHFSGTRRLRESVYPETLRVRFERGEAFVDTYAAQNSYVLDHGTRVREPLDVGVTDYVQRFRKLNAHWLRLIAGEEENYLTPADMRLNTMMSVAFQDSDFIDDL